MSDHRQCRAYFIDRPMSFDPSAPENGLLYIGMTDRSLDARCHFEHAHSGFSTFADEIACWHPPRNLTGWKNGDRGEIKIAGGVRE